MRHETCLNCKFSQDQELLALTLVPEALGADSHHHHAVQCTSCGAWWFDDVIIGGLGLPVAARRDTVLCACPEDGASRFEKSVVLAPVSEADCHCTAADVERYSLPIRMRRAEP